MRRRARQKITAWLLTATLMAQPLTAAAASVVPDSNAPGTNRPQVIAAENGVPVVQITSPSTAGISRNLYTQFNIDKPGLIFNNSTGNVQTQLAGYISGNPYLARGTARIILNEVTGPDISRLRGYAEIAGNRAELIIANPHGIVGDGFGFINTSRGILTTGTPVFGGSGSLDAFRVTGGVITAEGTGIDASSTEQADLISRAVKVNAGIWGKKLNVVTGANQVNHENLQTGQIQGDGEAPQVAVDVGTLGGMYANKIVLIGTERGVGVNSQGTMAATAEDITINSAGKVQLAGDTSAAGNLSIDADGDVTNQKNLYAAGALTVTAHNGSVTNTNSTVQSGGSLDIYADGEFHNDGGSVLSSSDITIKSSAATNQSGLIQSGGLLSLNTQGQTFSNQNTKDHGGLVGLNGIQLATGNWNNQSGYVYSGSDLTVQSADIDTRFDSSVGSVGDFELSAASLKNQGSKIQTGGAIHFTVSGALDNSSGLIRSSDNIAIQAQAIQNQATQGANQGIEGQSVALSAAAIGNQQGAVRAGQTVFVSGQTSLENQQGLLSAGKSLSLNSQNAIHKELQINNLQGTLIAGETLAVDSASLSGDGKIVSQGDVNIHVTQDYTQQGELQANRNLQLTTAGTLTNQSKITAGANVTLQADSVNNTNGNEISGQNTRITANQLVNRGLIDGEEAQIQAGNVTNLGTGRIYGDHLAIGANVLTNDVENGTTGTIAARQKLDLGVNTLYNREHSLLFSAGDLTIGGALNGAGQAVGKASSLNNNSATIEGLGNVSITTSVLNNTNEHFSTYVPVISQEYRVEYQGSGSSNRYLEGTPGVLIYNDESDHLRTPEESGYENWTAYRYTRTIKETRILSTDPAQLNSGAAMRLEADTVNNDKSNIVAGATLTGVIGTLNNTTVPGEHIIIDTGTVTSYWRNHKRGRDDTGSNTQSYNPADVVQNIVLQPTTYKENTATGGGFAIGNRTSGHITEVAAGVNAIVLTSDRFTLPDNSLFHIHTEPNATYLVETDPKFTDYKTWMSSDYMFTQLKTDPSLVQKRLGDGFYEQKLIRDQVTELTGRRYLDSYTSDEEEYKALMNNGTAFAEKYQLQVGVALTAEQMANLTTDIVWMVEKEVTLPNGETTKALVPQVYVHTVKEGELAPGGALISGKDVNFSVQQEAINRGTITGTNGVNLTADTIQNLGGRISGKEVAVTAQQDLNNIGGTIEAETKLTASAGRDLNVSSTTHSAATSQGSVTNIASVGTLAVTGDGGSLSAKAGRDMNLTAARIENSGETGTTELSAGNNLNLGTVKESESHQIVWDGNNKRSDSKVSDVGTTISAAGNIALTAGNDVNAKGAAVESAQGKLSVAAGRDVNLTAGEDSVSVDEAHQHKERGFLSSKTVTTRDMLDATTAKGTTLSGDSVSVTAGRDATVSGSNIAGTGDVTVAAKGNVTITGAQENREENHFRQEKTSGIFGGGGLGFTIGSKSVKTTDEQQGLSEAGSTVGSVNGNVKIEAGKDVKVTGSDVISGKDTTIQGQNVTIEAGENRQSEKQTVEVKQSGLSVSIGSQLLDTVNTVVEPAKRSNEVSDGRLKALYDYKAVQAVDKVLQDGKGATGSGSATDNSLKVSVSLGSSSQKSETNSQAKTAQESTVTAGGNVAVKADKDLTVIGSKITGENVTLEAGNDVNLKSAENTVSNQTTENSSSGGLGVSIGAKGQGGFYLEGAQSNSQGNGNTITYTDTTVRAKNTLVIHSGEDTNLKGAQAKGDTVKVDVGRNLNLESQRESDTYKESSSSSGGKIGIGTDITASVSKGKIDSNYDSVQKQTGIEAGKGGFDIQVGKNTDLKGAVISSTATPDKNKLSTDTLTYSDIQNKADYSASSIGVNYNTGKDVDKKDQGLTPNIGVTATGKADSTTKSAIANGTIDIRSNPNQDLSTLSRDTTNSVNVLGKIFDKKTVQEQQELAKVFGEEAFKAVGDLGLKEDDPKKVALKAVVGGIMSQMAGGSFASGATSAGFTQIIQNQLANIKDPATLQWVSSIIGATASKLVGGNATTGASIAGSDEKNNYLTHEQYAQYQAQLKELKDRLDNGSITKDQYDIAVRDVNDSWSKIDKEQDSKINYKNFKEVTEIGVDMEGHPFVVFPYDEVEKHSGLIESFIYDSKASITENVHKLLSLGGFTPLAPVSEGVNAVIYLTEGDNESAIMSAFAAIPGMKVLAVAKGAIKLVPETEEAIKFVQTYTKEVKVGENTTNAVKETERISVVGEARKYWTQATEVGGIKVYQRNDLINPNLIDDYGRTNLQRMEKGIAPIGPDGKSINLHHMTQTNDSAIAEVTQSFHQENTKVIHINPNTIPSGIDRNAFDTWKKNYWKNRANDFK